MTAKISRNLEWLIWGAILLLFVADRAIKQSLIGSKTIIINESIAFSVPIPQEIAITMTTVILLWLVREMYRAIKKKRILSIFFFSIFIGGLGNVIDRFYYSGVVDYISIFSWFPIFNIADVLITSGVVGVGLYYYYESHEKRS